MTDAEFEIRRLEQMIEDLKERVAKLERLFEQTDTSQSERQHESPYGT